MDSTTRNPADGEREAVILLYAQLIAETQALGESLLDGDGAEASFRAALVAGVARAGGLTNVAALADDLVGRLTSTAPRPLIGVSASYQRLSLALDQLLNDA